MGALAPGNGGLEIPPLSTQRHRAPCCTRQLLRSTLAQLHTLPLGMFGARCALEVDRAYTQWLQRTQAGARVLLRALETLASFQEPWLTGSTNDV